MESRRWLLKAGMALGLSSSVVEQAAAQAPQVRTRQDVKTFSQDQARVAALRAGVAKMKAVSAASPDDPGGWNYWASIHGVTEEPPTSLQPIYAQCDHTWITPQQSYIAAHFLSWHRAYLFFFESMLKAAAASAGAATPFELPYWNWYVDGTIPAVFTEGSAATNSLWHDRASVQLDPTALKRDFYKQKALLPSVGGLFANSFSVPLEMNPHGAVHGVVGGDMGAVDTSARDPIFWLHHANIDRLWTAWTRFGGGQANPGPNTPWGKSRFKFDVANKMNATASAIADSETGLGYRYDNYAIGPGAVIVAAAPRSIRSVQGLAVVEAPVSATPGGPARRDLSRTPPIVLRDDIVAIDLKMASPARKGLAALAGAAPSSAQGALVVVRGLKVAPSAKRGGFSYAVSVALPDQPAREVRLAEINTFTLSSRGHGAHHGHGAPAGDGVDLELPLKDALKALGVTSAARLEGGLRVYFRPAQSLGGGPSDPVSVTSVTLVSEGAKP